jgi:hypothetical protein
MVQLHCRDNGGLGRTAFPRRLSAPLRNAIAAGPSPAVLTRGFCERFSHKFTRVSENQALFAALRETADAATAAAIERLVR